MKPVKTIAAVGVAPELLQELKAAIERLDERLDSEWRWASEQNPDLLVLDPGDFAARMARTRAQVTGVRYVIVGDAAKHATDRFVLLRPFRMDAVAAVLNAAGSATVLSSEFVQQDDSFYTTDYETGNDAGLTDLQVELTDARAPDRAPGAAQGLDEVIRGDPLVGPAPTPANSPLPADASVEPVAASTQRSAARRDQIMDRMRRAGRDEGDDEPSAQRGVPVASLHALAGSDDSVLTLQDFLRGELLGGPTRLELQGLPVLTLDPKQRLFHADADLTALASYCTRELSRRDWRAVTSTELAQARQAAPGRDYSELLWLGALLRSEGRLATHLDPGGSYRITRAIHIDPSFHSHGPIVAAMAQASRLHEIAAAAQAPMDRVFDVVNAYESVGLLQWTPRPPRHAPPAGQKEGGLLSRLRHRLGKR